MLGFTTRLVFLKQTFLVHDNFLIREQLCEQAQLLPPPWDPLFFKGPTLQCCSSIAFLILFYKPI